MIISYTPVDPLDQALGLTPGGNGQSIEESVKNIWGSTQGTSFYVEEYVTGSRTPVPGTSYSPSEFVTSDMLCKIVPGTGSIGGANNVRMKIEASIDIYSDKEANVFEVKRKIAGYNMNSTVEYMWYISPKWICPVLDFSSSYASITTKNAINSTSPLPKRFSSTVTNSFHDETTGRGLWGGYGTDPYDKKAMKKVNQLSGERTVLGEGDNYEKVYFNSIT